MTYPSLPRILGPNLGCPEIVSPSELHQKGFDLLVATNKKDGPPPKDWSIHAVPSCQREGKTEGKAFDLSFTNIAAPREVVDDSLPPRFEEVAHTRRLVTTTLRSVAFEDKAAFWLFNVRVTAIVQDACLRRLVAGGRPLPTLYDLELKRADGTCLHRARHALCLRQPDDGKVHFAHVTDLHVAERNDLWADEHETLLSAPPTKYRNFNENARKFIRWANRKADEGGLDLVLALGDLVDFVEQGATREQTARDNWQLFVDIITGSGDEPSRGNAEGLRVPIFTSLGNHDWRTNPYSPAVEPEIFGLEKPEAEKLDYLYRDSSEALGKRIQTVHDQLLKEGSPILARSWWSSTVGSGLRGLQVLLQRLATFVLAWSNTAWRYAVFFVGLVLAGYFGSGAIGRLAAGKPLPEVALRHPLLSAAFLAVLGLALWFVPVLLGGWLGAKLRRGIQYLLSIEKDVSGLRDYFACINPYFNYAVQLEQCFFLVLETGHDCLTAQSFWDEGGRKIGRISISDNILGGSPDTMGFYPPNVLFPYGQITWMERVLDCVAELCRKASGQAQKAGAPRRCRVFVGVHSPPANLSNSDRVRADRKVGKGNRTILLRRKHWWQLVNRGFNATYGTINHYLSQFYYLCLGFREGFLARGEEHGSGCGIDVVLAGHAHWCQEYKLVKPRTSADEWQPELHYGNYAENLDQANSGPQPPAPDDWFGPLLLQTAGCGPPALPKRGRQFPNPPYVRLITVEKDRRVSTLKQIAIS